MSLAKDSAEALSPNPIASSCNPRHEGESTSKWEMQKLPHPGKSWRDALERFEFWRGVEAMFDAVQEDQHLHGFLVFVMGCCSSC